MVNLSTVLWLWLPTKICRNRRNPEDKQEAEQIIKNKDSRASFGLRKANEAYRAWRKNAFIAERKMSPYRRQNTDEIEERGLKSLLDLYSKIIGSRWQGECREREGKARCLCFFLLDVVLKRIQAKYFRSHSVSVKKCCISLAMVREGWALLLVCLFSR